MDVEPNKQSNDPPPEFTGTKLSEFKSYREKVKLWLSDHAHSSSITRATCFEQVDKPSLTRAGNSLSFGDVRKACKRYADEFLRDPN